MRHLLTLALVLLACAVAYSEGVAAPIRPEVRTLIEQQRVALATPVRHVPHKEIDLIQGRVGGGPDLGALFTLQELGPNVMPDLAEAIRAEHDRDFRRQLAETLLNIGCFWPRKEIPNMYLDPSTKRMFPAWEDRDSKGMYAEEVLRWWDKRDSFLHRDDLLQKIRAVTGTTAEDFARLVSDDVWNLFIDEVMEYGIYNLPYFTELVAQDNNPWAFCFFLGAVHSDKYPISLMDSYHLVAYMDEHFPSRAVKVSVIREWWAEMRGKYTELQPLCAAMDAALAKYAELVAPTPAPLEFPEENRPRIPIPVLDHVPDLSKVKRGMSVSDVETVLGGKGVILTSEQIPEAALFLWSNTLGVWKWKSKSRGFNYITIYLDADKKVGYPHVSYGIPREGMPE